jgi:heme/copper-type cytochrome/quinol oxidase subunit 2
VPYYPAQPIPPKKPNGNATAALIVSGGSLATLIFTIGFSAPLTLIASIVGTVLGHKGKTATDRDPEVGQRNEAIAGFWMGIAGIVLAVLAIAFWVVLILVLIAADPNSSVDSDWFSEGTREY